MSPAEMLAVAVISGFIAAMSPHAFRSMVIGFLVIICVYLSKLVK